MTIPNDQKEIQPQERNGVYPTLRRVFFAALAWKIGSYLFGIIKKPRHLPQFMSLDQDILDKGYLIANKNIKIGIEERLLPNGETKLVLCAGYRNFREPWARDLSFAVFGLMETGEAEVARQSLEVFLHFQEPSGQFPIKCFSTGVIDRYIHSLFKRRQPTQTPLRPKYLSGHHSVSLDGNALLVIAILNYASYSNDLEFVRKHWAGLKQAVYWLEGKALKEGNLLYQEAFSDWADSLALKGHVLYTNVIYWKVLKELADFSQKIGCQDDFNLWLERATRTKEAIQAEFWRDEEGYFINSLEIPNFSSAGNLLAIAWGLASTTQSRQILEAMDLFRMSEPVPSKVMHAVIPKKFIAIENRIAGIPQYHTQAAWLWLGAWHVISLAKMGRLAEADEILERIMKVVERDKIVYEVYDEDGNFLSTPLYTAEAPLTWSAGMIVYAYHYLDQCKMGLTGSFESEET
ncbi:MAG: hypothetical protein ABIJ65_08670 [Chloroflexota bacterium]